MRNGWGPSSKSGSGQAGVRSLARRAHLLWSSQVEFVPQGAPTSPQAPQASSLIGALAFRGFGLQVQGEEAKIPLPVRSLFVFPMEASFSAELACL